MIIGLGVGLNFGNKPGVSVEIVAPENLVAPAVTGDLDGILTCSTGTWTQMFSQTFTYQWHDESDDSELVGETGNTLDSQDHIGLEVYCEVTATNSADSASQVSNVVGPLEEFVAPDVTAPTLSNPAGAADGDTSAELSVDTDEGNGTLYWVVSTSATPPSAAQVKAGNDHTGSPAADSDNQSVSGTGEQNAAPTDTLTAETTYYAHFMHEDAASNQSNVVSSASFTTDAESTGLPTGAVGVWFMDAYATSPRRYIPNEATATAVTPNLNSAPRRLFSRGNAYGRFSCEVTDNNATGPDALTEASTVTSSGGHDHVLRQQHDLAAGTYTMGVYKRSPSGNISDRIRTGSGGAGHTTTTCNITETWQRFTHTFTWAGGSCEIDWTCALASPVSTTLEICDCDLSIGEEDLGPHADDMAGHIMLGRLDGDSAGSVASGIYVPGTNGWAVAQFAEALSLQTMTVIAVGRRARSTGASGAMIKDTTGNNAGTDFSCYVDNNGVAGGQFDGTEIGGGSNIVRYPNLWKFLDAGFYVHGFTYDDTKGESWLNRSKMYQRTFAAGTMSEKDLYIGQGHFITDYTATDADSAAIVLWDRALDDAEYLQAVEYILDRLDTESSITVPAMRVIVNEGDSITVANNSPVLETGGYAKVAAASYDPPCHGFNAAAIGDAFVELNARAAFLNQIPADDGGVYILTVMVGFNDWVAERTTGEFLSDYAAYYTAAKAGGWTDVVAISVLPADETENTGFDAWRTTVNAALAGGVGTYCDHFCDMDNITGTGGTAQTWVGTNMYDGIHPNNDGHTALAPELVTTIDGI